MRIGGEQQMDAPLAAPVMESITRIAEAPEGASETVADPSMSDEFLRHVPPTEAQHATCERPVFHVVSRIAGNNCTAGVIGDATPRLGTRATPNAPRFLERTTSSNPRPTSVCESRTVSPARPDFTAPKTQTNS